MDVEYKIVTAWPSDQIVELYRSAGWWSESEGARAAIAPMIKGSLAFVVATENSRAIGMGRAISDGCSDAYIQDVVVLSSERGRGVGKEIIKTLSQYCEKSGIVWIGLIGEPGTSEFYQKLGFIKMEGFIPMRYPTKELP